MEQKKTLEEHGKFSVEEVRNEQQGRINYMMEPEYYDCDAENGSLSFKFPVLFWEGNRVGNIHGGALASMMDFAIGALARYYAGEHFVPTISLDMKYIRPAKVGDTLIVTAYGVSAGRRIIHLTGEIINSQTGKLIASSASVYMNADTVKERE